MSNQYHNSIEFEPGLRVFQVTDEKANPEDIGHLVAEPFEVLADTLESAGSSSSNQNVELPSVLQAALTGDMDVDIPPAVGVLLAGAVISCALRKTLKTRQRANIGIHTFPRYSSHPRDKF